jgi:hypothetical protein
MSACSARRSCPATAVPWAPKLVLAFALLGCRASLPEPVHPLSATRRATLPAMPAMPVGDALERTPSVETVKLSNGLSVHVIRSPGARATTAAVAMPIHDSAAGCAGAAADVAARALTMALREHAPGPSWSAESWNGFFVISIELLGADPAEVADLLVRTLTVRPDAQQVTQAREHVFRSLFERDLGGPRLALAVLEDWRAAIPYQRTNDTMRVGLREVLGCLESPRPSDAKLAIASSADPLALRAALEPVFSYWRDGPERQRAPQTVRADAAPPRLKVIHRGVEGMFLAGAIAGPARSHRDYFAFSLLAQLFAGTANSRLQQALRNRLGLTYWTAADVRYLDDRSVLLIATAVDRTRLNKALQALDQELDALQRLSRPELEGARRSLREQLLESLERPEYSARQFVRLACLTEQPAEFMRDWIAATEDLSVEEVQRVARAYFRSSATALVLVGEQTDVVSQLQWTPRKYDLVGP